MILMTDYTHREPTPIERAVMKAEARRRQQELEFAQAITLVRAQSRKLRALEKDS